MAPRFPACDWVNGRCYHERKEYMWTSRHWWSTWWMQLRSCLEGLNYRYWENIQVERSSRQIRNDYETLQSTLNSGCSPGVIGLKVMVESMQNESSSWWESWVRRESRQDPRGNTNFLKQHVKEREIMKDPPKSTNQEPMHQSCHRRDTVIQGECEGEWQTQQRSHKWSLKDIHWIWSQGYH